MNTKDNNVGNGNHMLLTNTEKQKHKHKIHSETETQKHKGTWRYTDTKRHINNVCNMVATYNGGPLS